MSHEPKNKVKIKQLTPLAQSGVRPHFKISTHKINDERPGWIMEETEIPQFAIRFIIRQLYAEGYTNESILIEAV